jgi:hypothetical protein
MSWAYLMALMMILASICYAFIGSKIYLVDRKSKTREAYFIATLLLGIWALAYGLMTVADNEATARVFWIAGFATSCLFLPSWINFLFRLTATDTKASKIAKISWFLVAAIVFALGVISDGATFVQTSIGFHFLYDASSFLIILPIFGVISVSLMLYLQYKWVRSAKTTSEKKSAFSFTVAMLVFAPFAMAAEFFLPIIINTTVPPVASPIILIIGIMLFRILQGSKILNISIQSISEEMFSLVSQPILVLCADNRILLFNKTAKDFWADDISGKNMAELIIVDNNAPGQAFFEESAVYDATANITIPSSIGIRNCSILLSVIKDKYNDVSNKILIINDITDMQNTLSEFVSAISSASDQVLAGARQMSDSAMRLTDGSQEQAASVEQLSASISEIAEKTKNNAEMAGKAAVLASEIKGGAEKGSLQMDEMMTAVRDINASSHNISKVIKSIDDIAFQTNILALNAAVEAARAGQHGKGFAVVAEEVRTLAAKSAEAAKNTESLIADSISKAELGSRIADDTAASLSEIVAGIGESSQLVAHIAKSSEEQSEGITQINIGIEQVSQLVQKTSAAAEESATASQEMRDQSDMLEELVTRFKLKDGRKHDRLPPSQTSALSSLQRY